MCAVVYCTGVIYHYKVVRRAGYRHSYIFIYRCSCLTITACWYRVFALVTSKFELMTHRIRVLSTKANYTLRLNVMLFKFFAHYQGVLLGISRKFKDSHPMRLREDWVLARRVGAYVRYSTAAPLASEVVQTGVVPTDTSMSCEGVQQYPSWYGCCCEL